MNHKRKLVSNCILYFIFIEPELTVEDYWAFFKEVLEDSMHDRSKNLSKVSYLFINEFYKKSIDAEKRALSCAILELNKLLSPKANRNLEIKFETEAFISKVIQFI